jgi:serine/threonine-protein kinase RsbW
MNETRTFDPAPGSVTAARRFVNELLQGTPAETVEVVELMVSELASNCIRHTDAGFELTIIRTAQEVRVEATDLGGGEPQVRSPEPTDPSGRGLQIVDMLSSEWGHEPRAPRGKTVWFTVEAEAGSGAEPACASGHPAA